MKRIIFTLFACVLLANVQAQRITRSYDNVSLSDALRELSQEQSEYTLYFLYNELEDFHVTTVIDGKRLPDAIRQMIGFYPLRMTIDNSHPSERRIYVECTQKSDRHLTGTLIDGRDQPVPYANVALLSPRDSSLVAGGVSNEGGYFAIPCEADTVLMRVSCLGYKTLYHLCGQCEVGTLRLEAEPYTIQGVEVKGEVPQYRMTQGGMTVDVQHSILHDVGSAEDLLSMLPLVQQRDGKFEVLAKGEPEIYINNKKVRDPSELKRLKSADIKSVDIITAPGAKYNAEVNAVIRIQTIKVQGDGLSVMATSQTWRNNKWNTYDDLTLKYRTGGLETFANVALDKGSYSNDQELDQQLHISKDLFDIHAELPVRSSWTQLNYQAGLSYDFNTNHSVGLSFSSQKILANAYETDMQQHYLKNGAFYGDVRLKTNINEQDKPVWELNSYYVGKAGKLGIDLNATVLRRESDVNNRQQELSEELGSRALTTRTSDKNTMVAGKLVLDYPVWKGVLSGGSEATSTESQGHNLNHECIIPESDTELKENNIAAFAEYDLQLGEWHLNAGLRFEHVSADYTSFGIRQAEPSRTYNDWFPNLSAAWQKGKWGTQLSYSKRITRPPYNMLTSMVVYDSRMLYEGGNPLLRPSVRQSLDLNVTYSWLNFTTGFTRENDFFTHLGKVYDEEKEIAIFQPDNFDHQDRVYATLVISPKLGFWQPMLTLHYYQQMFDAEKYGAPKRLDKPEFSVHLNSWFAVNATTKALLQVDYTGSNHWGFMYRGSNFMANARVQKAFWDGRLSATLFANDLFRTAKTRITTYYAIGQTAQDVYSYTQVVGFTLSYNFNASRSRYRGTGAGNEEKSRF